MGKPWGVCLPPLLKTNEGISNLYRMPFFSHGFGSSNAGLFTTYAVSADAFVFKKKWKSLSAYIMPSWIHEVYTSSESTITDKLFVTSCFSLCWAGVWCRSISALAPSISWNIMAYIHNILEIKCIWLACMLILGAAPASEYLDSLPGSPSSYRL